MLTAEQVNETLKKLGDGDLCLDEHNCCTIMAGVGDDAPVIHLALNPGPGEVILMTGLGEIPEDPRVQNIVAFAMLKANFCWQLTEGRTIAYSDEAEAFVLQEKYTEASENSLEDCLLKFAEAGEALSSFYRDTVSEVMKTMKEEDDLDRNGFTVTSGDDAEDEDHDDADGSENNSGISPFFSPSGNDFAMAV